jgi:tetratricopeptide (TPR) repeat protein
MHSLSVPTRTVLQLSVTVLLFTATLLHAQQAGSAALMDGTRSAPSPSTVADSGAGKPSAPSAVPNVSTAPDGINSAKQLQPVIDVLTSVLVQYRKSGNRDAQASTLCALGNSYNALGQRQKAIEQFQQALALYRETSDRTGEVRTLSHIGDTYRGWGFPDRAVHFYHEALQGYSQVDDKPGRAIALNNLGVTYLSLRDKKKALEFLNQALAAYHEAGDSHGEALAYINIGAADSMLAHDPEKALEMLQEAVLKLEPLNDRGNQADAFEMIGVVWSGLRKQELAEANFKRALGIYREIHDAKGEASVMRQMRNRGVGEDVAYGR